MVNEEKNEYDLTFDEVLGELPYHCRCWLTLSNNLCIMPYLAYHNGKENILGGKKDKGYIGCKACFTSMMRMQ